MFRPPITLPVWLVITLSALLSGCASPGKPHTSEAATAMVGRHILAAAERIEASQEALSAISQAH
jgi:hypothetical protein